MPPLATSQPTRRGICEVGQLVVQQSPHHQAATESPLYRIIMLTALPSLSMTDGCDVDGNPCHLSGAYCALPTPAPARDALPSTRWP